MILDKIYVSNTEPSATNILWAKPIDGGAFALYAFINGKWGVLKLMNDNGTPYPGDDTPGGSADGCYTKEEIDSKLADILGLDAEGVAELKALIEDDDALTGLLNELKDEVKSVEVFHYLQGSHKPLPVGKYNYTISGLINVPKNVYNEGNYLIFRYPEDITTNSFHYLVFEEKTVGEVTGYFCVHSYSPSSKPPAWVEDTFGYTRSEADDLLNNKVDKEQDKGLSTNDYTTAEKTKLSDLPTATALTQTLGNKANTADLAPVATSGSYNDLSDQPTLDDLNKVEDLYALDATNSDWKRKVDKMFDDGTFPTISKTFDYCNLRIYDKRPSDEEYDTTAINSLETTEEGLTFADGTHFSSYKIGEKYYVGYLTGFFINKGIIFGNIEITCTKSGTLKLYLYKCVITEDAYFKINGQPTAVEMPTTNAATILSFDVNEGDVITVSPTRQIDSLHYYTFGLVGMSFYSKYPVSRFANDAGYLTEHQDISGKVNKNEMSVVPGTGANADKTTITLKQGTFATVLTAHQDISGKENAMPITTATGATLTAIVGNYYRLDNVGTLAITLPTITGATKLQAITFLLACGSSALVTFAPQGSETILYQEDFALEADTTYEVTALWNGSEWTLSRIIYE